MELTDSLKALFRETAMTLKGSARRLFMARTVKELGSGGQRRAERDLGWNRKTLRKGMHELERGMICLDNFSARGRKRAEEHLPTLLTDIAALVDSQSQADPQFRTQRLYTRLDAGGSTPPIDRPEKLYRCRTAHRADDYDQAQRLGLLPTKGRQE